MVSIHFEQTEILDLDPEFFVLWFSDIANSKKKELGEVAIIFCSDEYLLEVNREYLKHDYYTDIITFDYTDGRVSGDLFISVDRVRDNAEQFDVPFNEELNRVCAHGLLHLLGYKDKTELEAKEMREQESFALDLIVPRGT